MPRNISLKIQIMSGKSHFDIPSEVENRSEQLKLHKQTFRQNELDRNDITWNDIWEGDIDCELYHELEPACHCYFAQCNENCQVEDSFIEYVEEALCSSSHWARVNTRGLCVVGEIVKQPRFEQGSFQLERLILKKEPFSWKVKDELEKTI